MKKAFTLIELLVVVLIIGILAAVAVPQYQKAVEKSRIAAALPVMENVKKNMELYLMEHGWPSSETSFLRCGEGGAEEVIDVSAGLSCNSDSTFYYEAFCEASQCVISAYRSLEAYNDSNKDYQLRLDRESSATQWTYWCEFYDDFGQRACSTLQGQGNWLLADSRNE